MKESASVAEQLHKDIERSNCLVTRFPAMVRVRDVIVISLSLYSGPRAAIVADDGSSYLV